MNTTLEAFSSSPGPIIEELTQAIQRAEANRLPFGHVYMRNVFSQELYEKLLLYLPATDLYDPFLHPDALLSATTSSRLRFPLSQGNLDKRLSENQTCRSFWRSVSEACCSPVLKTVLFDRLKADLLVRFRVEINKIPASPQAFLFRDLTGYSIKPHPDSRRKAVTVQLYLPRDESLESFGTALYVIEANAFRKVKQFPFKPNTGYAFAVSDHSWHGVETISVSEIRRDSLMIIYYLDQFI
ncbi:MAG: hypothetical protein MN733_30150 [Nitrososphaera sp.]|nr:hypothetical protein [Nitrososphaera sp.]